MTERLQEILNRKPSKWGNLTVKEFERDIKLLQESVQELEKENRLLRFIAEENKIAYEQRTKQNKRYREALEFYADEEHYKEELISEAQYDADGICISNDEYAPPVIYFDSGEIARKALERDND